MRLRSIVRITSLALLMIIVLFSAGSSVAQTGTAELRGTVEDKGRGIVVGATVTVTDTATGIARHIIVTSKGTFSLPDLQPATYNVEIAAPTFATVRYPQVELAVGADQVLTVVMQPAQVQAEVTVEAVNSGIELASSTLQGGVDPRAIRELPLNGRDWTQLSLLDPGVAGVHTQNAVNGSNSNRSSRGLGAQVDVNGNRPTQNAYFLDGLNINDYANSTPGNAFGVALGVDAIQEFTVLTSNYNATIGQASGGVINAVSRTGTNKLHGDVYEYLRNDFFDARNYFDPVRIPPLRRNQFGAAVGGPIWKDHTFFFANYEGLRWLASSTTISTVPSANARMGILSTGNVVVSPAVVPFLALWPAVNDGLVGAGDVGNYLFVGKSVQYANFGTAKIDHTFSQKDTLSATYVIDDSSTSSPDSLNSIIVMTTARRNTGALSETHIFTPQLVNAFHMGVNEVEVHGLQSSPGANPAANTTALGILPGRNAPYLSVPSITAYTGGVNGTAATNFVYLTPQFYDDVSWQKGAHTLKFGAEFLHYNESVQVASVPNGEYDFNTLPGFLTNQPSIFYADLQYAPGQTNGVPVGVGFPERGFRQSTQGYYLQDDWRILPNLTLNLGVRYERSSVPTEEHGRLSNIYNFATTQLNPGAPLFVNPTNRNFEPRVGFAWDPYKGGKTSVRGSFGIFDVLPLLYEYTLLESYAAPASALAQIGSQAAGSFPNGGYQQVITLPAVPLRVAAVQNTPPRNYILQDSVSVQQQFTNTLSLTVSYAGNHGVHMVDIANDANYGAPVLTPNGYQFNAATRNTALGGIRQILWGDSSNYNGLQVKAEKKFGKGFQFTGAYTWSRTLDGFSSSSFPTTFQNSLSLLFFNRALNHGPSDYNQTHVAVLNGLWDLPKWHGGDAPLRYTVNGWQVSGLLSLNSGTPFTPVISGDALKEGISSPYDVPNVNLLAPGCNSHLANPENPTHYINTACYSFAGAYPTGVLGNARRNSIYGPGAIELDLTAARDFRLPLTELSRLQFRLDVFNATNHTNFQAPTTNNKLFTATGAAVATAGQITSTSTTSRELQLALKLYW